MKTRRIAWLLPLVLTGCAVGPDFRKPIIDSPREYAATLEAGEPVAAGDIDAAWFSTLGDDRLDRYVADALAANHDLRIATSRVREARAQRSAAAGRLLPDVAGSASAGRGRISENAPGNAALAQAGVLVPRSDLYQVGFDASWEIDAFGGKRRAIEAANARVDGSIEARRDTMVTVVAEVVRNYVEFRGLQRQLATVENNIRIQQDTLELVETRVETGLASALDASRARSLLESSRARRPGLRIRVQAAAFRLAVLTGKAPADLLDELQATETTLSIPTNVPVGLPSELLLRRPDLRHALTEVRTSNAEIGVAVAELYPKFALTGNGGYQSVSTGSLIESASRVWSIGGLIRFPIFQGGRIRAGIEAARARHEATVARYEQTVLLALEEVETAIVRFGEQQEERDSLRRAAEAARESLRRARVLYDNGLTDYLDVLEVERSLTLIEDQLASGETRVGTAWVALYKALGGGAGIEPRVAQGS